MFSSLHVKNFILIDDLSLNFKNQMSVFTGETGAGKSLIMDATRLLLGGRLKNTVVRDDSDKAIIEGVFENYSEDVKRILDEYGIENNDELIIRREISQSQKSTSRINGILVTSSQLEHLGFYLLDIHTQNDTKKLFVNRNYFDFIDDPLVKTELVKYNELRKQYNDLKLEYDTLINDFKNNESQKDFLIFQYNELKNANLKLNEEEEIEQELDYLNNFEHISNLLSSIKDLINDKTLDNLYDLSNELKKMENYDSTYQEMAEKVNSMYYDLEDVLDFSVHKQKNLEYDENRLNELNERMDFLNSLTKKYHQSIADLINYQKEIESKIDKFENSDFYINEAERKLKNLESSLIEIGKKITNLRKKNAVALEKDIVSSLNDMLLPNVKFKIDFKESPKFLPTGCDIVDFLISFNKGQDLSSLKDVASGGEMSRIMLALKVHLIKNLGLSTIIFDEIDTGISRNAAYSVGKKLKELSKTAQVIEITHLPIVASFADQHFFVSKEVVDDKTIVKVNELTDEERIKELSVMLNPNTNEVDKIMVLAKELLENRNL